MVQVEVAGFNQEAHTCNGDPECADPKASAYPTAKVVTAVAPSLLEREPEIVEFLKNMSFTNAQMGEVLAWQDANGASYEEAAVYFLQNFGDVWGNWLNDDARSKLSALLK